MKREAESQVRVDRTRIIDPKSSIEELFHAKARGTDHTLRNGRAKRDDHRQRDEE
jgi:hypothetical protein